MLVITSVDSKHKVDTWEKLFVLLLLNSLLCFQLVSIGNLKVLVLDVRDLNQVPSRCLGLTCLIGYARWKTDVLIKWLMHLGLSFSPCHMLTPVDLHLVGRHDWKLRSLHCRSAYLESFTWPLLLHLSLMSPLLIVPLYSFLHLLYNLPFIFGGYKTDFRDYCIFFLISASYFSYVVSHFPITLWKGIGRQRCIH